MAIDARFFDGKTAAERAVRVTIDESGLHIGGEGISDVWRRDEIDVLTRSPSIRLAARSMPDARLILALSHESQALLRELEVIGKRRALRRGAILIGALTAASAALLAIIFVGAPMAAEPLARRTPLYVEEQLGENMQQQVQVIMRPCKETSAADLAIEPLIDELAYISDSPFDVRLTFVRMPAPNALALPGGRILVTSGLLDTLENPDELAAVLAHELGHVQARDSMVSLYRNAGLGIVLEAVTGGSGVAQQIILLGGQLAELRFTRAQEQRADTFALRLMADAGYDPEALARAFERLKQAGEEHREARDTVLPDIDFEPPEWLYSHPDLDMRITAARAAANPARNEALSAEAWNTVRAACSAD